MAPYVKAVRQLTGVQIFGKVLDARMRNSNKENFERSCACRYHKLQAYSIIIKLSPYFGAIGHVTRFETELN